MPATLPPLTKRTRFDRSPVDFPPFTDPPPFSTSAIDATLEFHHAVVEKKLRLSKATTLAGYCRAAFELAGQMAPFCCGFICYRLPGGPLNQIVDVRGGDFDCPPWTALETTALCDQWLAQPSRKILRGDATVALRSRSRNLQSTRQTRTAPSRRHLLALIIASKTAPDQIDAVICLSRGETTGGFQTIDEIRLASVHEDLSGEWHRIRDRETEIATNRGLRNAVGRLPIPLIVMDWDLQIVTLNRAARDACDRWRNQPHLAPTTPGCAADLPGELQSVCERAREGWISLLNEVKRPNRILRYETTTACGLRATVTVNPPANTKFGTPTFQIEFEVPAPEHSSSESSHAINLLTRLAPAERDVVSLVRTGMSNQEIADALGRSLPTIKAELRSVFCKLRVASRTQLMVLFAAPAVSKSRV